MRKETHLRFADEVVIFVQNETELKEMLQDLWQKAKKVGLEINTTKTKFITNENTNRNNICGRTASINMKFYVYLGQRITGKENQELEVS